ncbi:unnamed protein product, partial [Chrysoparadoxa australica]
EPVLIQRLGEKRLAELDIDSEPLAAASLGQVHRATRRSDGRELCIKIQYPGLAEAIGSDIATLTRIVRLARLVPRGVELSAVMHEVQEMIYREVDYMHEARMTREYAQRLADDDRYVVPEVFDEYSTDTVLVTSFEVGEHVRSPAVQELAQARRDRLGRNALALFFGEFFEWGRVQTDPHFGNYRIRLDDSGNDQIVLLDFGAVREFEPTFLQSYFDIGRGAFDGQPERLVRGAVGIGLLRPDSPQQVYDAF